MIKWQSIHSYLALLLLSVFTSSFTSVTYAQTNEVVEEEKPLKYYDVEVILFKNLKVPKGNEKTLPSQAPQHDEVVISFNNQQEIEHAAELGFTLPEENEIRLRDMAEKIERSSRYKLLQHLTWRQPGLAKEDALSLKIRTGEIFGNDYSSIDSPVKPNIYDVDPELQIVKKFSIDEKPEEPELVWYELEGKITISLARYLHAHIDLVLRVPNENDITIEDFNTPTNETSVDGTIGAIDANQNSFLSVTLNNYSFKERRRMRSRKLHFLDHPEIGMLILITPYEAPETIEFIEDDLNLG